MQNPAAYSSGGIALRRGAVSLAVASLFAAAGAAQAFEIDTGNEDLAMRWDNTFRYNLGVRAQGQDQALLKNPNLDDGDRNFSNGSLVTNRLDILSEFDVIWQKKYGMRVSAAGWYDAAYGSLDNTNTATANTLVNGLPVAGELSPYTKRYAKGAIRRMARRVRVRQLRGRRRAGQRQGRPAHGVLGREPAAGRGDPRAVVLAELARCLEGLFDPGHRGEGAVPAARRAHHPGAAAQRPVDRRAVVLQLAGGAGDGIGFVPDVQRRGAVRRRFGDRGAEPVCRQRAGVAGVPAGVERLAVPSSRYSGSLGDWGLAARWSPAVARRHAGLLWPQCDRHPAAAIPDARTRHDGSRRRPARPSAAFRWAGPTASSTRTRPASPTSRRRASSAPTASPTATTSTCTG